MQILKEHNEIRLILYKCLDGRPIHEIRGRDLKPKRFYEIGNAWKANEYFMKKSMRNYKTCRERTHFCRDCIYSKPNELGVIPCEGLEF